MGTIINASILDLLTDSEAKAAIVVGDEKALHNILYQVGFNIKTGVTERECYHRPKSRKKDNDPWWGIMYSSYEREDKEWLNSGYASEEVKLDCCEGGLRDELLLLSKRSNFSADICNHVKNNYKGEKA